MINHFMQGLVINHFVKNII